MKQSPKVVFFGSGPVAAASLQLLLDNFNVEAVITKPNPPHHRGTAPVIELAGQKKLTCFTPKNNTELTDLFAKETFKAPVGIVIDYGIIIAQPVIDYFYYGIVNSHFSLLPQWRGADPITFSLLSGQPETGVSLMSIVAAMDEGPLLSSQKLSIQPDDTSISLTQKLIQLSDKMLIQHLPNYLNDSLSLKLQQGNPTYSRKLTKADGIVDWSKPAVVLEREIRAFYQWPKSTAQIGPHSVIIRETDVINTSGKSGEYQNTKKELIVHCGEGSLKILRIQPVNKKEMPVEAFLAGYTL